MIPPHATGEEAAADVLQAVQRCVYESPYHAASLAMLAKELDVNRNAFSSAASRQSRALLSLAASRRIGVFPAPVRITRNGVTAGTSDWSYLVAPVDRRAAPAPREGAGWIFQAADLGRLSFRPLLFQLSLQGWFPDLDVAFGVHRGVDCLNALALDLFPVQLPQAARIGTPALAKGLEGLAASIVGKDAVASRLGAAARSAHRAAVEIEHAPGAVFQEAPAARPLGGPASSPGEGRDSPAYLPPPPGSVVRVRAAPSGPAGKGPEAATRVLLRVDRLIHALERPRRHTKEGFAP